MKEKKLLRKSLFSILIAVLVLTAAQIVVFAVTDRDYSFVVPGAAGYTAVNLDQDGIVTIVSEEKQGEDLRLTLRPVSRGEVLMEIQQGEKTLYCTLFTVNSIGIIKNTASGNFTGSDMALICTTLFFVGLAVIMWGNFSRARRNLYFSYQTMFYGGFGIWVSIMAGIFAVWTGQMLADADRFSVESYHVEYYFANIAGSGRIFMLLMTPFLVIFAVFMVVSNVSLMKHERKRLMNAVGMALGVLMVLGEAVILFLLSQDRGGSDMEMKAADIMLNALASLFSVAECLLLGAILCGWMAAKHEPAYDKDFILILGCKIRKDGTLFPLIRGRVDRAIAFYEKQLKQTGKKAVFIPSGGQGSDEVLSEGEAMKRYLLSKGIAEDQILAETKSANTFQNMQFSAKIIRERKKDAKVVFSTTNYHVFRSGILSVKAGLETDGMGSSTKWYFWPNAFVREFLGLISYCRKKIILIAVLILAGATIVELMLV